MIPEAKGTVAFCARCKQAITSDGQGSWVDETDGDGCEDSVHAPTPVAQQDCPNALAGILCDCAYCEDDDLETLYHVTLSVVVHLAGPPARHTAESIHENVMVRLLAGDYHDTDKTEVLEVRIDRRPV